MIRLKTRTPGGGGEISGLLAQLQGDISGLRKENDNYKAYYSTPGASRGTSFGQAFLMTIGPIIAGRCGDDCRRHVLCQ